MELQPGTILHERYQISGLLAIGGLAVLYRAEDLNGTAEYPLVLKILRSALDPFTREDALEVMQREVDLLSRLAHPGIPRLTGFFTHADLPVMVREFAPGRSLEDVLHEAGGPLPAEDVRQWGIALCDILTYLHTVAQPPIIYRDMKPENAILMPGGGLMLIDFGAAVPFIMGPPKRHIGTEGYAAPEQYKGVATPTTDIYGLGATLHHLLTGQDPRDYPPHSFADRAIRAINPDVPPALETAIAEALHIRTEPRLSGAAALRAALIAAGEE